MPRPQVVETEAPPALDDIKMSAKDRNRLIELCKEYRILSEDASAIEAQKKALMEHIKPLAEAAKISKARGDGFTLVKSHGGSTKIEAHLLLEEGVDADVIEKATVRKTWDYYQVLAVK